MIYLGLGTNLGQRLRNLQQAVELLAAEMRITAVSSIYQTPPWGITDQPDFYNCAVSAISHVTPQQLLITLKEIEKKLGRQPTIRWGPRLIDIDLLFYDDLILEEENLTIPHPRMPDRLFVLAPLADIAPDFVHPQTGVTVREMLAVASENGGEGLRPLAGVRLTIPTQN